MNSIPGAISRERLITFGQAADLIRELTGGAYKPNCSTLHRWATRGVRGRRLEVRRVGRRWFTSAEAVRRFMADESANAGTEASPTPSESSTPAVGRRVSAAVAELHRTLFTSSRRIHG